MAPIITEHTYVETIEDLLRLKSCCVKDFPGALFTNYYVITAPSSFPAMYKHWKSLHTFVNCVHSEGIPRYHITQIFNPQWISKETVSSYIDVLKSYNIYYGNLQWDLECFRNHMDLIK